MYRNAYALPRAWVVASQRVVEEDDDQLEAFTAPGFDARNVAVTAERLAGLSERPPATGAPPAGRASIERIEPERVIVRARSRTNGLLVLSDLSYPGWRAAVDGREADVERVDYMLRGVRLPAGTHEVTFTYEPLSFRVGWIVSLVALFALIVVALLALRRRRGGGHTAR